MQQLGSTTVRRGRAKLRATTERARQHPHYRSGGAAWAVSTNGGSSAVPEPRVLRGSHNRPAVASPHDAMAVRGSVGGAPLRQVTKRSEVGKPRSGSPARSGGRTTPRIQPPRDGLRGRWRGVWADRSGTLPGPRGGPRRRPDALTLMRCRPSAALRVAIEVGHRPARDVRGPAVAATASDLPARGYSTA